MSTYPDTTLMVKHPPCGNSNRQTDCRSRCNYWLMPSYHHSATKHKTQTSLKQIFRNGYYCNTNGIPRSSLKNTPSSLPTKRLQSQSYSDNGMKQPKPKIALGANYAADRQAGRLAEFLNQLRIVFLAVMMVAYHTGPINKP